MEVLVIQKKAFSEFKKLLANQLRAVRGSLTQAQLALLTKFTQQMISRYESGRIPRAFWFLSWLAEAGVDLNRLFLGKPQKPLNERRFEQVLRRRGHWK